MRRDNETNEIITSSFSWTSLGWREAESRTGTAGKHKWFPQTLFFFFQIWQKNLFYQVQEPEWLLPAPQHRCSPSVGKFCQQHIIIGFIQPNYHRVYSGKFSTSKRSQKSQSHRNDRRLCPYMAIGMRGWICFPQPSRRMLIRVQGFSRDNRRLLFLFSKGFNYTKPKEWFNKHSRFLRAKQCPKNAFR